MSIDWQPNTPDHKPPEDWPVLVWSKTHAKWTTAAWRPCSWPNPLHWVDENGGHFAEDDEISHWAVVHIPPLGAVQKETR